jgi:quercetin dioxygenase-like cupin family protein
MNSDNRSFCELAPLYALDSLNADDQRWVEAQIAECPELSAELAAYQAAVDAIPYGAPIVPVASDLKTRLFASLGMEQPEPLPLPSPEPATPAPDWANLVVRSRSWKWRPYHVPRIVAAPLHLDQQQRKLVAVVKAEPGALYPAHAHAGIEEIFMLTGDLTIGEQVYEAGDYIRSELGTVHTDAETRQGCMFLVHTSMDDRFLAGESSR